MPLISLTCLCVFVYGIRAFDFPPVRENPCLGPRLGTLVGMGAQTQALVTDDKDYWRLVSSLFVHAGLVPLATNLFVLNTVGAALEAQFGSLRVALLYLFGGVWGSAVSAIVVADYVCAGAPVFTLLGADWADLLQNWRAHRAARPRRLALALASSLASLVVLLLPGVNGVAGLAGLACGLLVGASLLIVARFQKARAASGGGGGARGGLLPQVRLDGVSLHQALLCSQRNEPRHGGAQRPAPAGQSQGHVSHQELLASFPTKKEWRFFFRTRSAPHICSQPKRDGGSGACARRRPAPAAPARRAALRRRGGRHRDGRAARGRGRRRPHRRERQLRRPLRGARVRPERALGRLRRLPMRRPRRLRGRLSVTTRAPRRRRRPSPRGGEWWCEVLRGRRATGGRVGKGRRCGAVGVLLMVVRFYLERGTRDAG